MHCILKLEEFAASLKLEPNQSYSSTIVERFADGLQYLLQVTMTNSGLSSTEVLELITKQKRAFKVRRACMLCIDYTLGTKFDFNFSSSTYLHYRRKSFFRDI